MVKMKIQRRPDLANPKIPSGSSNDQPTVGMVSLGCPKAFGHPNETIPTVGWSLLDPLGIFGFARSGRRCIFIFTIS